MTTPTELERLRAAAYGAVTAHDADAAEAHKQLGIAAALLKAAAESLRLAIDPTIRVTDSRSIQRGVVMRHRDCEQLLQQVSVMAEWAAKRGGRS